MYSLVYFYCNNSLCQSSSVGPHSRTVSRRNISPNTTALLRANLSILREAELHLSFILGPEVMWNANLMQLGNFIDVFLARHVSGTYADHQEH